MTGAVRPHRAECGTMRRNKAVAHDSSRRADHADAAVSTRHRAGMDANTRFSAAC
jgi:hypothetical protein